MESLQSTLAAWMGEEIAFWKFGIGIFLLYSPLVWIRRLETFKKAFVFAVAMIALGVATTSVFAVRLIQEQEGPGPELVPLNHDSYLSMIGFAFFMFEGIGCLLPIMRETEKPE